MKSIIFRTKRWRDSLKTMKTWKARLEMMKEVIPINTDTEGCSRCIKAQYYKMGFTNFTRSLVEKASAGHRQYNRIYSSLGIHPTLISSETQGRYYVYEGIFDDSKGG